MKRALLCAGQGIGNVVMTTPALRALASTGYRVDIALQANYPQVADLLKGLPDVENVFIDRPAGPYDAVVRTLCHRGPALGLGPEVCPDDCDLRAVHEADANLSAVRQLGFAGPRPRPRVRCIEPAVPLPERYIVCAPGYSRALSDIDWRRKAWPHWTAFVDAFRGRHPATAVVALGGPDARELWPGGGDLELFHLPLVESAGVLAKAAAVVAVDNGLAHVAAALGTPTRVLFGGTRESKNRPLGREVIVITADRPCRPCQWTPAWDRCTDWRCMADLSPKTVLEAL